RRSAQSRAARPRPRSLAGGARCGPEASSLRLEAQRGRVDAITQARRARPIGEHVAEMSAATRASHFLAHPAVRAVLVRAERFLPDRLVEARPAGAGVVLRLGAEKLLSANHAEVLSGCLERVVLARERPLRPAFLDRKSVV